MLRQNFRINFASRNLSSIVLCGVMALTPQAFADEYATQTVVVPASEAWTRTGLHLLLGSPLHIEAEGRVSILRPSLWEWIAGSSRERFVGPQGTYLWPDSARKPRQRSAFRSFPVPTMADGPAPAYGLIAKIGEQGRPFSVGSRYDGVVAENGELWLGINNDHPEDHQGAFTVTVTLTSRPLPPEEELPFVEPGTLTGRPLPGARVLLLYIDGLRPDVLREMAEDGFLPHFKETFLAQGLAIPDAFTVFPSNTLIANGSLFTGLFSDRTGIKSQNQFERTTLKPTGQLSAWLADGFMPKPRTRVLNLLDKYAPENTHAFLVKRGVPTLAGRLGKAYRYTTLPITPLNPPPQWLHRAINTIGPFQLSRQLPARLDEVNAQYAIEELIGDPDARVFAIWFPMVDKTCHHSGRGQFGLARRDLALADRLLGRLLDRLREVGWDRSTYLILVSDHGHLGGEAGVNRRCNLPRDWAHGAFGRNARVVGQEWTHPGLDPQRFFFFDNQGAGQAKLFLPYGSYVQGPWRRNRLFELTHYALRPTQPSVNLLESLTAFRPPEWDGQGPHPIDLILVKLDERRAFVYRDADHQAIIHRLEEPSGREVYRYEPVKGLTQSSDGALHYEPARPGEDPFGYLRDPSVLAAIGDPQWLGEPRPSREWLRVTAHTRYPDAVVTMAKFFAWQPPVDDLAELRDPDLVVTANEGWSFRSDEGEGTDHGYPLAESMRITCFLSGPNIVHGTLRSPHRIVDVFPTILELIGWPYDATQLDGEAITGIYE